MRIFTLSLFFLVSTSAAFATTVELDFEDDDHTTGFISPEGFRAFKTGFTFLNDCFDDDGQSICVDSTANELVAYADFDRIDGTAFSLVQLDVLLIQPVTSLYSPSGFDRENEIFVQAWDHADNLIAQVTLSVLDVGAGWQTMQFGPAWSEINRFRVSGQAVVADCCEVFGSLAVDNVTVNVVPLPAAVWLFGSALAGLGWIRRKQSV